MLKELCLNFSAGKKYLRYFPIKFEVMFEQHSMQKKCGYTEGRLAYKSCPNAPLNKELSKFKQFSSKLFSI